MPRGSSELSVPVLPAAWLCRAPGAAGSLVAGLLKAPVGHLQEDVQKSEVLLFTLKFHFESELHFKWCGK